MSSCIPGTAVAQRRYRSVNDVRSEEVGAVHALNFGLLVGALRGVRLHGAAVHVVVILEAVRCRPEINKVNEILATNL